MSTAAPSIESDQRAGLPVVRRPYGMTDKDVADSMIDVARRIREGMRTASIQSMAGIILRDAGFPGTIRSRAQAILDYVRKHIGYVPDPPMVEMIKSATITLCVPGAPLCIPIGDCDDLVVACGSMLASAGMMTWCLVQDYGPQQEMHILCAVEDEGGRRLAVDPSHPTRSVGPRDSAIREIWMDPTNPQELNLDTPVGEFVGVGRPKHLGSCCSACAEGKPCTGCGSKVHPCPCETGATLARRPMFTAIGAAAGTATGPDFTQAQVDINQMSLKIQEAASIAKGAAKDFALSIKTYQDAGSYGVSTVGPSVDASGLPNITQPYTQQAWKLNQQLAVVGQGYGPPSQDQLDSAATLARAMITLYQSAIAAAQNPPAAGSPPAGDNSSALGTVAAFAVGGGLAWAVWRNRRAIFGRRA